MNKKKKEGEGMKKENVHAKHKKSLAERFWKQKYLFLLLIRDCEKKSVNKILL